MTVFTGIVAYLIIWWLVLFTVLPWGVQRNQAPQTGEDHGAPLRARMWLKVGITTLIAFVVWGALFFAIEFDVFSFRDVSGGYTSE